MPTTTKIPASAFDASNALFNGQSILLLELGDAISGLAISTAGVVTQAAHTREVGDCLVYKSSTSGDGILAGDVLHVISVDAGTYTVSATHGGTAIAPTTAYVGAVLQPAFVFEAQKLDDEPAQELKPLSRADRKGVVYTAAQVLTKADQSFSFELEEAMLLERIFGGFSFGLEAGYCTIWKPDARDADTVCAKVSERFKCEVTRDGTASDGGDWSKPKIKISSTQGRVAWLRRVTVA